MEEDPQTTSSKAIPLYVVLASLFAETIAPDEDDPALEALDQAATSALAEALVAHDELDVVFLATGSRRDERAFARRMRRMSSGSVAATAAFYLVRALAALVESKKLDLQKPAPEEASSSEWLRNVLAELPTPLAPELLAALEWMVEIADQRVAGRLDESVFHSPEQVRAWARAVRIFARVLATQSVRKTKSRRR